MRRFISYIYNCERDRAPITLATAMILAIIMIGASWFGRGSEQADALFIILICLSSTTILIGTSRSKHEE